MSFMFARQNIYLFDFLAGEKATFYTGGRRAGRESEETRELL